MNSATEMNVQMLLELLFRRSSETLKKLFVGSTWCLKVSFFSGTVGTVGLFAEADTVIPSSYEVNLRAVRFFIK